ncbi:hypothetical protein FACS1894156_2160 [Bacteroidia bacterium]|nr:hypothetical protein FACS1894156_2160 [Bacteroidia bacterium]
MSPWATPDIVVISWVPAAACAACNFATTVFFLYTSTLSAARNRLILSQLEAQMGAYTGGLCHGK